MAIAKTPEKLSRSQTKRDMGLDVLPPDRQRDRDPLSRLVLNGRGLRQALGGRLIGLTRSPDLDQGATLLELTLHDPDGAFLAVGVLGTERLTRTAQVVLDGIHYSVIGDRWDNGIVTLTCEPQVVTNAKRHGREDPIRESRADITRAGFVARELRASGAPVIVLDEKVVQPIAKAVQDAKASDAAAKAPERSRTAAKGLGGNVTVQHQPADTEQRQILSTGLGVAQEVKASPRAAKALVVALIQESRCRNLTGGDSSSVGPLQLLDSHLGGSTSTNGGRRDVALVCKLFFTTGFRGPGTGALALSKSVSGDAADLASAVQGNRDGSGDYRPWSAEADKILEVVDPSGTSFAGSDSDQDTSAATLTKQYAYERLRGESTWQMGRRLLVEEVRWRLFEREGVLIIGSDKAFMRAPPSLTVSGRQLSFERHRAQRAGEASGTIYVPAYASDPGEVVQVEDLPAVESAWLLVSAKENLMDRTVPYPPVEIQLRQPQDALPEPASERVTPSSSSSTGTTGTDGGGTGDGPTRGGQLTAEMVRGLTPANIINQFALPIARRNGIDRSVAANDQGNASHGPTSSGGRSDHQGPPTYAWAADLGIGPNITGGGNPTGASRGDRTAQDLADFFGIPWPPAGLHESHRFGFRFQLIWRYDGHYDHVHIGVRKEG